MTDSFRNAARLSDTLSSSKVSVPRLHGSLILALLATIAGFSMCAFAQDDPNERPLGDVARSLRRESASKDVIDNDNLSQVMEQAESQHASGSALKFLMAGESKDFQVAAPDVTCSLSFRASTKSLLSSQYAQMELPQSVMPKLSGPATIEGDTLTVSVFNATDWHISEIAVALTVVKSSESGSGGLAQELEVRPEKKQDVTVIYKMRAAAPPATKTVFSARLNLDLAPGDEWHWAIVQAKGYPPQGFATNNEQEAARTSQSATDATSVGTPTMPPSLLLPQEEPAALSQNPR